MKSIAQLSVKEEGQQKERPPSTLKVKGNSSLLVRDPLGASRDENFQNNLHCQLFCLINN